MRITDFTEEYVPEAKIFTDEQIGEGYFEESNLKKMVARSQKDGVNCSFVLLNDKNKMVGLRLTFPPGNWNDIEYVNKGLTPENWKADKGNVAYFQSLFLSQETQGQGWGSKLSNTAIEALKKTGATAAICHSWKESPGNSSFRYLNRMGFEVVKEHNLFWNKIPYDCVVCGEGRACECTAVEMIKYF